MAEAATPCSAIATRNWLKRWMQNYFNEAFDFVFEKECNDNNN